jgi:hypothetical protein
MATIFGVLVLVNGRNVSNRLARGPVGCPPGTAAQPLWEKLVEVDKLQVHLLAYLATQLQPPESGGEVVRQG